MNISHAFAPALDYVRRHVSQEVVSNERLAGLLGAAGVLILLSGLYGLWSLTSSMGNQLEVSKATLARLQAEASSDAWPARLEAARALKTQLTVQLWDAPTPGLAEASFETWLRNNFSRHGGTLQQVQITRSPALGRDGQPSATLAGLQRMTAKVIAPFDQRVLVNVLADAADAEKIIIVDRVIVRAGANSRLEMDISTFIRSAEAAGSAQARP
jgi:hypothetical protein